MNATATAMPTPAETKFCTASADHLREVAHARLADVGLPVGVGREADRGVEREQARHVRHVRGLSGRRPCSRRMTYMKSTR